MAFYQLEENWQGTQELYRGDFVGGYTLLKVGDPQSRSRTRTIRPGLFLYGLGIQLNRVRYLNIRSRSYYSYRGSPLKYFKLRKEKVQVLKEIKQHYHVILRNHDTTACQGNIADHYLLIVSEFSPDFQFYGPRRIYNSNARYYEYLICCNLI